MPIDGNYLIVFRLCRADFCDKLAERTAIILVQTLIPMEPERLEHQEYNQFVNILCTILRKMTRLEHIPFTR